MLLRLRKFILILLILALTVALYGWWQRDDLLGWYYFRQLGQVEGAKREVWVKKLVELDQAVMPRALECWRSARPQTCADSEEVLIGLVRSWKDARVASLLKEMLGQWGYFSEAGKNSALLVACAALAERGDDSPVAFLCTLAQDLLQCGTADSQSDRATLFLAGALLRVEPKEMPRQLLLAAAEKGLHSQDYDVRCLALRLFLQPPLNKDAEALARIVPFLQDVAGDVRRLALLVVGSNQELVSEDELLPLLHDADAEVCRYCEVALRSRGLQDRHMILARLISDVDPRARLEVLQFLEQAPDLDQGVWLRRLCQDACPAVRAAAIRAAARQEVADLRDRLRDMAQNDASETVRQLAGYYLQRGGPGPARYRP